MNTLVKNQTIRERYALYNGDSCEVLKSMPDNSIHYSIFSPPFAQLYVYSNSHRDLGNCKTRTEFYTHFGYIVKELFRTLKPGRLISFHCMNLPLQKARDGVIGLTDFRGELIRIFESAGFIYHSEVCIWKDPVVAMQRTKALGLLHKQLKKDSCMSRQGLPDYLVTMRKDGNNVEPVQGELKYYSGDINFAQDMTSVEIWQRYASPVWMDINQSLTLQKASAKDNDDEKHLCPLQLQVIERALQLWTNENDIVLSPFMGIGSEIYQSLKMKRRGVGIELKESYYNQAVLNCEGAINEGEQISFLEVV